MPAPGPAVMTRAVLPLLLALVVSQAPAADALGIERTEHFRIEHTARAKTAALQLGPRLEAERARFRSMLGRDWPGITDVRLGVGRDEMNALALGGPPPAWAVALAYPDEDTLLLEAASLTDGSGAQTLRHELSHVALGQLGHGWPRWFQEGFAMVFSGERFAITEYATLFRAVRSDRVFHFDELADRWPEHAGDVEIAYAQSASFVAELLERHSADELGALLDETSRGVPFETAFARAFHTSVSVEEDRWRFTLPNRYGWVPLATSTSLLWLLAACLCVLGYVRLRSAQAHRRAILAAEEAAEDAALRIATAAPAIEPEWSGGPLPPDDDEGSPPAKPTLH